MGCLKLDNYVNNRFQTKTLNDFDISIWLSVDPMSDKYPSLSPFNYCALNPVMLVDPDGRDIDPTSVTQEMNNMIDPSHESYNKGFAEAYKTLENDHNAVYSFNSREKPRIDENGKKEYGSVTYDGKNDNGQYKIGINYSNADDTDLLSSSSVFLEETKHAVQFSKGEYGFIADDNGKQAGSIFLDIFDEAKAKVFAAQNATERGKIDNDILFIYKNDGGYDGVADYLNNSPVFNYKNSPDIIKKEMNYIDFGNEMTFDQNGKSTKPHIIYQKPKN